MPRVERLQKLSVRGFRSLRNVELELGDLTVLIGANGSGKSNLVSFFNLLSFMLSGSLRQYVGRKGGGSAILHYGPKQTPVMTADLRFDGTTGTSDYGFSLAFASPDGLIFTDEHVGFKRPSEPKPFERLLGVGQAETALLAIAASEQDGVARTVARVFVNRLKELYVYHFHDTSETAPIRTAQDVDRNRMLLSNGGNLAAYLHMLQTVHPAHFERIVATVRLAVPYLRTIELAPDRLNTGRIQLRWTDGNSDYDFGAHQLSDGSLRAIAIVTALLQPEELMPSLIVLDEPELGLHPSAVGLVGQLIKAASTKRQVIVATQSPRLLSECAVEDVVVVEREEYAAGHGESTFKRLTRDALGEWLNDYSLGALYEMNVTGGGPQ